MDDVFEALFRLVAGMFRFVLEGLLEWFWWSGIRKLPRRVSAVGEWWRRESAGSKIHSVVALVSLVTLSVPVLALFSAFFGFDWLGLMTTETGNAG